MTVRILSVITVVLLAACSRPSGERVTIALPAQTPASPPGHVHVVAKPGRWLHIHIRAKASTLWVENCNGQFMYHFANAAGVSYPSTGAIDACRSAPVESLPGQEVVLRERVYSFSAMPAGHGPYRLVLDSLRNADGVMEPLAATARISQPFTVEP